jgi:hypothetical protein
MLMSFSWTKTVSIVAVLLALRAPGDPVVDAFVTKSAVALNRLSHIRCHCQEAEANNDHPFVEYRIGGTSMQESRRQILSRARRLMSLAGVTILIDPTFANGVETKVGQQN